MSLGIAPCSQENWQQNTMLLSAVTDESACLYRHWYFILLQVPIISLVLKRTCSSTDDHHNQSAHTNRCNRLSMPLGRVPCSIGQTTCYPQRKDIIFTRTGGTLQDTLENKGTSISHDVNIKNPDLTHPNQYSCLVDSVQFTSDTQY